MIGQNYIYYIDYELTRVIKVETKYFPPVHVLDTPNNLFIVGLDSIYRLN